MPTCLTRTTRTGTDAMQRARFDGLDAEAGHAVLDRVGARHIAVDGRLGVNAGRREGLEKRRKAARRGVGTVAGGTVAGGAVAEIQQCDPAPGRGAHGVAGAGLSTRVRPAACQLSMPPRR